jgi:probable F420-dependent oxidoreductase
VTTHPFRLGVSLAGQGHVAQLASQASRAEQIGFDSVLLVDHLGFSAPLSPLVAMAAAAPSVRVGTHVINASFHRPALLARELATVDSATGGRLDIGLGAGYVEPEFTAAGVPFMSHDARVRFLLEHITEIRSSLSDVAYRPPPIQQPPPILVGAMGNKLLSMAAQHADIVAIATLANEDRLVEQVDLVKRQAGSRLDDIDLAFGFFQVSIDRQDDLSLAQQMLPGTPEAELRQMMCVLDGSVADAVERIRRLHELYGISYFILHKSNATSWHTLETLVDELN